MKKESHILIVFYDSWCPLCTKIKKRIKRLDWLNKIKMESIREVDENIYGVTKEDLEKYMYAINIRTNKIVYGIDAFSAISLRIPILFPLWPILAFVSRIGIGQKLYQYFAKRRLIIPIGKCSDKTCKINYK